MSPSANRYGEALPLKHTQMPYATHDLVAIATLLCEIALLLKIRSIRAKN